MSSLAYRITVLVISRRPQGPMISSHALERRRVLPGMPNRGSSFVRVRTHQRLKRLGSVKIRKIDWPVDMPPGCSSAP
jgi:hypothetical protein